MLSCKKKDTRKRKKTTLLSTKAEVDGQVRILITPLDIPRAAVSALWANDRGARRRRDDLEPVVPEGGAVGAQVPVETTVVALSAGVVKLVLLQQQ